MITWRARAHQPCDSVSHARQNGATPERAGPRRRGPLDYLVNEPFSSWLCLADLQYVDGLGELAGAPGTAAELAEDAPGLELGVRSAKAASCDASLEPRTCGPDVDQEAGWIKMCAGTATYGLRSREPITPRCCKVSRRHWELATGLRITSTPRRSRRRSRWYRRRQRQRPDAAVNSHLLSHIRPELGIRCT